MTKGFTLPVSFFLVGFLSTTVQIILVRELFVVFYGNEILLSLIFFWWFFSIGLGAYIASILPKHLQHVSFYILLVTILFVIPELQIFFSRAMRAISGVNPGEWVPITSIVLYVSLIIFPFGFIIGVLFPFASSIGAQKLAPISTKPKTSAGFVYSFESLGSMFGGIITSLIFLKYLNHIEMISWMIFIISIAVILLSLNFHESKKTKIITISLTFFLTASLIIFGQKFDKKSLDLRWKSLSTMELVEETDSVYQNILLGKLEDQYSIYGNGSYVSSFPDDFKSESLSHLFLSLHPNPKDILFSAEGSEEMLKYMLPHNPESIDLVQIDSKVHKEIVKYLSKDAKDALLDKRVTLKFEDSKRFLRSLALHQNKKYDLIISLAPDPITLNLNRYFTLEFFRDVKESLKNDGIFITAISSTESYLAGDVGKYLGSIYKTARSAFQNIFVIPGTTAYIVCSHSVKNLSYNLSEIEKRFADREIKTKYFTKYNFSAYLQKWRIEKVGEVLEKNLEKYQTNSDSNPITFLYSLKILSQYSGKFTSKVLSLFTKTNIFHYLGFLIFILIVRISYMLIMHKSNKSQMKFNSLLTIGTTGFIGFALELIILYLYQSQYGYIYQRLGIVVGFFMLGLFGGSLTANRFLEKIPYASIKPILLCEIAIGLFSLLLPFIFKMFPYEGIIFSFSLLAGFLTGFEFPLVNKIYFEEENLVKSASLIDSLDHFGAALGALLCGIVLIPILGIPLACVILLALKMGCVLLWTLGTRTAIY